jgi:hypothetical protein
LGAPRELVLGIKFCGVSEVGRLTSQDKARHTPSKLAVTSGRELVQAQLLYKLAVGNFETAKASNFNNLPQLSRSSLQKVQHKKL